MLVILILSQCLGVAACSQSTSNVENQVPISYLNDADMRLVKEIREAVEKGVTSANLDTLVHPAPQVHSDYPIESMELRGAAEIDKDPSASDQQAPDFANATHLAVWVRPGQEGLERPKVVGIVWYTNSSPRMFLGMAAPPGR